MLSPWLELPVFSIRNSNCEIDNNRSSELLQRLRSPNPKLTFSTRGCRSHDSRNDAFIEALEQRNSSERLRKAYLTDTMLRRAPRSPCARLAQLTPTAQFGALYLKPRPNTVFDHTQLRIFTTNGGVWRRQNDPKRPPPRTPVDRTPQPPKLATSPAPASRKPTETLKSEVKKDGLLSEATVTRQEQRKADWAIMKEMAKYLWPKVRWSAMLTEDQLLRRSRTIGVPNFVWEQHLLYLLGQRYVALELFSKVLTDCLASQRPSTFLL